MYRVKYIQGGTVQIYLWSELGTEIWTSVRGCSPYYLVVIAPTGSAGQSIQFTEGTYPISVEETFLNSYPPGVSVYPNAGSPRPTGSIGEVGCVNSTSGGPVNVSYSTINGSACEDPGPFDVDPVSGGILVTADLDYEVQTSYMFCVRCTHDTQSSLTDTATVEISILPINEFAPEADPNLINIFTGVDESLAIGIVMVSPAGGSGLYTYELVDLDEGGNEVLKHTLSVEPEDVTPNSQHFSLDPNTGALTLTGSLDVDSIHFNGSSDVIRLSITVCDMDPPSPICPNIRVGIFVIAANDNLPVFEQDTYEETVPEDLPVNSTLDLGIVCTDDDRVTGSLQGIELSNQNLSMWAINSEGIITLREPLNFETTERHEFTIKCLDTESNEDEATVVINVGPVNDNPPHFDQERYHFDVDRTETPDYTIGTVRAFDNDGDIVTFSIRRANDNFEIDANTGEIKMVDYILATEGDSFTLTVIASDGDFTATSTVTIDVVGSLSVVGIAAVTTSIVTLVSVLALAIGLVCCRTVCVKTSRTRFHSTKIGIEMSECAAYDVGPQNEEPARTNRDSVGYEPIPSVHARILPQTSRTSLNSTYEPIPEDALPWQYYYRPTQPHNHYDYVRERPPLELPPAQRLEWQSGRGTGGQESSVSDGSEEGRRGEHGGTSGSDGGEEKRTGEHEGGGGSDGGEEKRKEEHEGGGESDGGEEGKRGEHEGGQETHQAGGREGGEGSEEVQNKEEICESEASRKTQGDAQTNGRYVNIVTTSTTSELSEPSVE